MKKILQLLRTKWPEYLIEIVVIIIGILLAFALNNWNEKRKAKQIESKLLEAIHQDFSANKELLGQSVNAIKTCIMDNKALLNYTGEERYLNLSQTEFAILFRSTGSCIGSYFAPNTSVLQELISSGTLSTISSVPMRRALTDWNSKLMNLEEQMATLESYRTELKYALIREGSLINNLLLNSDSTTLKDLPTQSGFGIDNRQLLLQPEVENNMAFRLTNLQNLLKTYETFEEDIDHILSLSGRAN